MIKKINWKRGSGSLIYGCCIVLSGLLLMMLTIERDYVYHNAVYLQTRIDTAADGSAEYGYRAYGLNEDEVEKAMSKITYYNNNLYDKDVTYTLNESALKKKNVQITGNIKVPSLFTDNTIEISGDATTHAISDITVGTDIDFDAYPTDPTQRIHPKYRSMPEERDVANSTRLPDIINQFEMLSHPRYISTNHDDARSQILLWDFTVAMGCEIPMKTEGGDLKTASEIYEWMQDEEGQSAGWKEVTEEEAQKSANEGHPAVIIDYKENDNGKAFIIRNDQASYSPSRGAYVSCAGATVIDKAYLNEQFPGAHDYHYFIHK